MSVRFLHAADIHLGYRQYGSQERQNDFTRAFERLVDHAIASRVDFVLIAGDLFHKRIVEARTFVQAAALLTRLRDAGIPVLCVEGNHERPYFSEGFSWLDGLAELNMIRVLSGEYVDGTLTLMPWDSETKTGAFVDIKGVRVYGLRYMGASTPRVVADLAAALERIARDGEPRPACSVMMLHAGLEGVLDQYTGTVTRAALEPLRTHIDYVALGHIHKPYEQDHWLFNPGSLENNSTDEVQWDDRGYYVVDVDPGPPPTLEATLHRGERRMFLRHRFDVNPYETPAALMAALQRDLERMPKTDQEPVLELRLTGILNFDRGDLDLAGIQELATDAVRPLISQVRDDTATNEFEIRTDEQASRQDLERRILREILERDVRWRPHAARWAEAALQIKQMSLAHSHPSEVVGELRALLDSLPEDGEPAEGPLPC